MRDGEDLATRTRRALSELGLSLATAADIDEGRAVAAALLGEPVTSAAALHRIQARTACSSFVARDAAGALQAAISIIPLTAAALPVMARGAFDGLEPPQRLAARPQDQVCAFYGWGMAGIGRRGRALAVTAAMTLQREVYGHVPFYARAASDEGERILHARMGARPLPGSGGLVWAPSHAPVRKAA